MGKIEITGKKLDPNGVNSIKLLDAIKGEPIRGRRIFLGEDFGANNNSFYEFSDEECAQIREILEKIKKNMREKGITSGSNNYDIKVLMYLYGLFQTKVRYANPIMTFNETSPIATKVLETPNGKNIFNAYGMFVDNYACCAGMADGMVIACQYFGVPCKRVSMRNGEVLHAANYAIINGKEIHFDLSAEIGFSDGKYRDFPRIARPSPLVKTSVTYNHFGKTKSEFEKRGKKFSDSNTPEGIRVPEELCEKFKNVFKSPIRGNNQYNPVIQADNIIPKSLKTKSKITINR